MSINVTVNGSPVNIRRGKLLLVDNESLLKKEFDRRRILRLEQVRQQSKDIARKVIQKSKGEKDRQQSVFEQEQINHQKKRKIQELLSLQKKYECCLQEIGRSHVVAASEPDVDDVLEVQRRKDAELAAERSRTALELLRQQRHKEKEQAELAVKRKQCLQSVEDLRATLVRNLAPRRKDKQPLAEVSVNIQPVAEVEKCVTHRVADLGHGPTPCSCSTARLCECLTEFSRRVTRDALASQHVAQVSPIEVPPTASTCGDKTSCTSLFALDSRVSLVPPGDDIFTGQPLRQESSPHRVVTPPLTSVISETLGQAGSRAASPVCPTAGAVRQHQGDAAAKPSQRSSSGIPPPPRTAATTTVGSSGQRGMSNRGDHKVQFYDYSSRFEKEVEAHYTVHRHNSFEEERGSAMTSARLEAEQRDSDGCRSKELQCRQQERSQAALARERLRCDYQRLLQQLPAFARASGTRLPAAVHLGDERRQQRDALRQSNMATVFERLHHSLLQVNEAAPPSPYAASVTVSPRQTDDETPPKLNVGVCTQAMDADLGEGTLAAALESLQARLEQQRALLHSEVGVLPERTSGNDQQSSTTHMKSRKVCKKGKVHVHKPTISKDTSEAGKQTSSTKEIDHRDKQDNKLESGKPESTQEENQYCKQENSSMNINQVDEQEVISKDRSQEYKREVRSKDTNQENKREVESKDRHQRSKREVRSRDWHQEGKRDCTFKERINRDKRDSKSREKKQESRQKDKPEDRDPKINQYDRSKEQDREGKQQGKSKEKNQEYRQKHRSKEQEGDSSSRESSHDGSEIIMSEYSLDVSRSKRAEVTHSSVNSTEQSSSNSVHVYEDMKLMFNLKEVIRSPGRVGDWSQRRKHVCKKSIGIKKCRKRKLHMVEEGTQTSTDPGNGGKPPVGTDFQRNGQVMESSGSTAYLSPPQYLSGEQADVVDQLLHVVQHQKEEVEELLSGRGRAGVRRETNPTLMLYIARLLSMSRASVEDLSIASNSIPQEIPCECESPDSGQGKHEKTAPLHRQPQPANASPVTGPQSCTTSQAVCQPACVVRIPSTLSSQEVSHPEVFVQPTYKPPQTNVTSAICEPKMCTLPTDWFADSHVSLPEINVASSFSLSGHESFENCNSEGNDKLTTQNNCDYTTSLLDVSLDMGSTNQLSGNISESENSVPSYPEFWNKYHTISRQYTERISEISAQIQSLREARKQLESDQNAVLSPVDTSTPLPPADTTTSSVEIASNFLTWRSALASEASLQQRGRQPRQKPPSALDRNKLMARPEVCGPAHELSTIVEVDTPQSSHVFASTTVDQPQDVDSDDTLPDVAAELLKRGLITSTAQWQAEAASSFVTEEQQLAQGSGVQDLEAALARLGMSWASSTLRKVRQAEQLSTTSSETASAARHCSPPQEVRGHSTPFTPTPTVCFPSESDMSTVHPSPESLEVQIPDLGRRHASLLDHDQAHVNKPARK